ncbi:SDR family oxidoreductase [Rhodococcus triatomae]|nr:short-chain dehydrogenase/reductase SDR [Rhodococcus triatomae BKS 15-14]
MSTVGVVTGAGRGMGLECARRVGTMVDTLLLVDLDGQAAQLAAEELSASEGATVEPFHLDVTDRAGLARLADRVAGLGDLRAVAHVAGISPTMADWRRIVEVDLVGTALLAEALRPLATAGTAFVYFSSMAPTIAGVVAEPALDAALDEPLHPDLLDRIHTVLGAQAEHPGAAYVWAKYGVRRFAQREAIRLGPVGARACSVSPGIIDTPQGRQESEHNPSMEAMVRRTPLGRAGRAAEVAAAVAFALSDEASFLNGVDLLVDGGVCAATRLGEGQAR